MPRPTPTIEPLADMAKEYVRMLEEDQPDGLGQWVHSRYGVSHNMLYLMQRNYGPKEASAAIDQAFARYHNRT
jgi:hypothetical protein